MPSKFGAADLSRDMFYTKMNWARIRDKYDGFFNEESSDMLPFNEEEFTKLRVSETMRGSWEFRIAFEIEFRGRN